jgi:hypothetical protein
MALAIWLGWKFFAGGERTPHTDASPVVTEPPRQLVAQADTQRAESGPTQSPEKAEGRPATKTAGQLKSELMNAELAKRPEVREAINNNIRRLVLEGTPDLEILLGVDRATADKLGELLYERALVIVDVAAAMRERGISLDDPRYEAVSRNLRQDLDLELKAVAGEDKFELVKLASQVQQRQNDLTRDYSAQLRQINAPLSADQSLQLAILMAKFDVRDASGEPAQTTAGPGQYLRPNSDVPMLEAAGKILTPAQLEVVRRRLIDENLERDFRRELKEEIYPANGLK